MARGVLERPLERLPATTTWIGRSVSVGEPDEDLIASLDRELMLAGSIESFDPDDDEPAVQPHIRPA